MRAGLSPESVAEAIDVPLQWYLNLENGTQKEPNAYTLTRLTTFLGCTLNELYVDAATDEWSERKDTI